MITDIEPLLIGANASIADAMTELNAGALGCLLLTRKGRLLDRVITDGDLRRLLIAGHDMAGFARGPVRKNFGHRT